MKIEKFRIWNYKSITDSKDCYPAAGVTILAGKNESGKTSILEALEDFNVSKSIREKSVQIKNKEVKPKIAIWFKVSKEEMDGIFKDIEHSFPVEEQEVEVQIIKTYPNTYEIEDASARRFRLNERQKYEEGVQNVMNAVAEIQRLYEGN